MFRGFIFKPVLFLVLLLPNKSFGQQLLYHFQQFTANDGLPSSEVHQVLRDSRNFMWFATDHGVCRYDGYNFETFDLPFNSILSLYEDSKNRIWAASFSGQLFYYENGKFYDYKYNDLVVRVTDQIPINRIYVDSLDNVFVSTTAPDCFVINKGGQVEKLFEPNINCTFKDIETDKGGLFSYASGSFMSKGEQFFKLGHNHSIISILSRGKNYKINFPKIITGTKMGAFNLNDGSIVFYCGFYLFRILSNGNYSFRKFNSYILDAKELNSGNLFVATIQNGLYIINRSNKAIENYFQTMTITSIEKDYEDGIWISTAQAGAFYLSSFKIKHLAESGIIIDQKIFCLTINPDSSIWAGEEAGKILEFNYNKKINYFELPAVSITGIFNNVFPKTLFVSVGDIPNIEASNIPTYQFKGIKFVLFQGSSGILKFKGNILIGRSSGIFKLNFPKKKTERINKEIFRVSSLFQDHNNDLLVGNVLGLWKFLNNKLEPYDSSRPIFNTRITDINEYVGKYLLLGTRGKGLVFAFRDSIYQIELKNGLASNNIRKIFVDENIIWLATNRGISRMTIQSLDPFRYDIRNISVEDGLLSNEVNDIKRLDSNIIIATNRGVSFFRRNLYSEKQQLPVPLYITGVKINNLDTVISQQYNLYRSSRNISISYVGLSYRKDANIEYRYRLLGIDSSWVYTKSTQIQFNPIPYGTYTVQIEARRLGEEWNENNIVSVTINCQAPFWRTTWFGITAFLFMGFLMLLFFIGRTKKIKLREKERTGLNKKLAEMELKALRAQMNPHFIFNVLNSIQYFIMHNENEAAQTYMSKFAKLVRQTLDNSRSTFISLADELSLLKIYIDLEKIRFEDRFEYLIDIGKNIDTASIQIPNMLLQPYVENSIKHGFKSRGIKYFLNISISKEGGKIICTITDNGIGRENAAKIPDAELEKHASSGTIIVEEKIEALKLYYKYDLTSNTEDLKNESGNAIGTRVILIFPEQFDVTETI